MEILTLIEEKCPNTPPQIIGNSLLSAESLLKVANIVVGMQLRVRPEMYMHGYAPTGRETRRELQLRYSHARRWAEFFHNHMAAVAGHSHDSEEIIRYILGMDFAMVHTGGPWPPLRCTETDSEHLILSHGYSVLEGDKYGKHLAYGINDPALCLGSLGVGEALFVAPAHSLLEFYHEQHIGEIVADY